MVHRWMTLWCASVDCTVCDQNIGFTRVTPSHLPHPLTGVERSLLALNCLDFSEAYFCYWPVPIAFAYKLIGMVVQG